MTGVEPTRRTPEEDARIEAIAKRFVGVSDSISIIPEDAELIRDLLFRFAVNIDETGHMEVPYREFLPAMLEAFGRLEARVVVIEAELRELRELRR